MDRNFEDHPHMLCPERHKPPELSTQRRDSLSTSAELLWVPWRIARYIRGSVVLTYWGKNIFSPICYCFGYLGEKHDTFGVVLFLQ